MYGLKFAFSLVELRETGSRFKSRTKRLTRLSPTYGWPS